MALQHLISPNNTLCHHGFIPALAPPNHPTVNLACLCPNMVFLQLLNKKCKLSLSCLIHIHIVSTLLNLFFCHDREPKNTIRKNHDELDPLISKHPQGQLCALTCTVNTLWLATIVTRQIFFWWNFFFTRFWKWPWLISASRNTFDSDSTSTIFQKKV